MRNLYKPNRYNVASIQAQQTLGGDVMQADENGQYVEWRDYKWLLDEVERLKDQVSYDSRTQLYVDKLAAEFTQWEVEKLKAEVERLRKAGDWMCGLLQFDFVTKEWNAAKEGKQS